MITQADQTVAVLVPIHKTTCPDLIRGNDCPQLPDGLSQLHQAHVEMVPIDYSLALDTV